MSLDRTVLSHVRTAKQTVHLNWRGRQLSQLLTAEVSASAFIIGSNAGYTMFRASVKGTGYPLHSPVSPSLPLPCVAICRHISTGVHHFSDESTASIFTVDAREVRLFHISCALIPLARAGIWLLSPTSIFLAIWQSHMFTLCTSILQMGARILSEPLFRVALK